MTEARILQHSSVGSAQPRAAAELLVVLLRKTLCGMVCAQTNLPPKSDVENEKHKKLYVAVTISYESHTSAVFHAMLSHWMRSAGMPLQSKRTRRPNGGGNAPSCGWRRSAASVALRRKNGSSAPSHSGRARRCRRLPPSGTLRSLVNRRGGLSGSAQSAALAVCLFVCLFESTPCCFVSARVAACALLVGRAMVADVLTASEYLTVCKKACALWRTGIPTNCRRQVWPLAIGNRVR